MTIDEREIFPQPIYDPDSGMDSGSPTFLCAVCEAPLHVSDFSYEEGMTCEACDPNLWEFWATVTESMRRAEWESIFGVACVPIKSPVPQTVDILGEDRLAVMLKVSLLTADQRERLTEHLRLKFNIGAAIMEGMIERDGVPIPCDSCIIHVQNPGKWIF